MLGVLLGYTNDKAIGSDEGINLISTYGKLLITIIGNVDGITLDIDIGTELGFLHGSFDGSNDIKLEGLLLGVLLGSTNYKALGSDEGIKLGSNNIKLISTILGNVDGIILGLDVGT